MVIKLLEGMMGCEGIKVHLFIDGKRAQRRVYYRTDCGLYIIVKNHMIFEYDFRNGNEIEVDL